jgi:hypothetical protein
MHKDVFLKCLYRKLSRKSISQNIDEELFNDFIKYLKASLSPMAAQDFVTLFLAYKQAKEQGALFTQFYSDPLEKAKFNDLSITAFFINASVCNTQQTIDRIPPHVNLHPDVFQYLEVSE